jgi:hypothetical protein
LSRVAKRQLRLLFLIEENAKKDKFFLSQDHADIKTKS